MLAVAGLEGPLGTVAGGSLLALLAILFSLLVNALLKTSSKSDEINSRLVAQKDEVIADKDRQIEQLTRERDIWFRKYDEERGKHG